MLSVQFELILEIINPIALRMAKTLWSFGRSECNRVKVVICVHAHLIFTIFKVLVLWMLPICGLVVLWRTTSLKKM